MFQKSTFTVYDASAGSGKTFTLVKAYLKILLQSNNLFLFKNILAITFTNKAVNEMKERIIKTLSIFADSDILDNPTPMFRTICQELELEPELIHQRSKKLLDVIIHNYASFDISTIDGFTHKLIRTFAFDLKLPLNFEVELDAESLLNEAVDSLISKAGTDEELTRVLVDFAIEKADDDKSWDISFDLNKIGKLLFNEQDLTYVNMISGKSLEDFKRLKNTLKKAIEEAEIVILEKSKNILFLIAQAGLAFEDFTGKYLPNHFQKLSQGNFDVSFGTKWQDEIETGTLYPKRVTESVAAIVDSMQPQIAAVFHETKTVVFHRKFLKAFYKNITPLSVLNAINNELNAIKTEQNKLLISEFNLLISNELKDQPTPFIYERIGEKFKHYFIDEFQDTSIMQWQNLIPLINNALSSENNSALLVGDAKQAIYRWRGGQAEQFIGLLETYNPFQIEKNREHLQDNYRSFREIVQFNNRFFDYLASKVFSHEPYAQLYQAAAQNPILENQGYVELTFLDISRDEDRDAIFGENVLEIIEKCLLAGFQYRDICILVRKRNKEAVPLASFLSAQNVPVISSDSLLLSNSPEVLFLTQFLGLLIEPNNHLLKVEALNYLASRFQILDKHAFFEKHLPLSMPALCEAFKSFGVDINFQRLTQDVLYDMIEALVRSFGLIKTSDAYVQYLLDLALDYSLKKGSDLVGFLTYFEKNKGRMSISSPLGQNAVQIMTIHKSKGLEFPVVIFPYADLDIYREIDAREWYKLDEDHFQGFTHTLLNYNKDFNYYGEQGLSIANRHQAELELDNINLLYVALTRAIEQLYIVSKKDIPSKGSTKPKRYSEIFIDYLQHLGLWQEGQLTYGFGDHKKESISKVASEEPDVPISFISTEKETHRISIVTKSGYLWDTHVAEAIEKGNLIHTLLSHIKYMEDIDLAIDKFTKRGTLNSGQAKILKDQLNALVNHPELKPFYRKDVTVYNERDLLTAEGSVLRPDRVVIYPNGEAVIIDYKTGVPDKTHEQQLQLYEDLLQKMNLQVKKKILVYLNDDLTIKTI